MTADTPRVVPIHQSAHRPAQIRGCDRVLILTALFAAFCLAFSLLTVCGFAVSAAFWFGAVEVLRRMGKADPLLRQVYIRHLRYRDWYPAKSGLLAQLAGVPKGWR
jgi:type IV secretory pathway TrbD component